MIIAFKKKIEAESHQYGKELTFLMTDKSGKLIKFIQADDFKNFPKNDSYHTNYPKIILKQNQHIIEITANSGIIKKDWTLAVLETDVKFRQMEFQNENTLNINSQRLIIDIENSLIYSDTNTNTQILGKDFEIFGKENAF